VEQDRLAFLFGPGVDPVVWDLDDVEVRSALLERSFADGLDPALLLSREVIANHIYADDPPEVCGRRPCGCSGRASIVGRYSISWRWP
jgi:hypothetical protein